jgi:hypothetical protein
MPRNKEARSISCKQAQHVSRRLHLQSRVAFFVRRSRRTRPTHAIQKSTMPLLLRKLSNRIALYASSSRPAVTSCSSIAALLIETCWLHCRCCDSVHIDIRRSSARTTLSFVPSMVAPRMSCSPTGLDMLQKQLSRSLIDSAFAASASMSRMATSSRSNSDVRFKRQSR